MPPCADLLDAHTPERAQVQHSNPNAAPEHRSAQLRREAADGPAARRAVPARRLGRYGSGLTWLANGRSPGPARSFGPVTDFEMIQIWPQGWPGTTNGPRPPACSVSGADTLLASQS